MVFGALNSFAAKLKEYHGETPALSLPSLEGQEVNIDQFKGKITLVQFWATYCTPCRVEMPSMNRLMTKMGDDFVILAVDMGETKQEVQAFVDEVKPEFTILLDQDGQALGEWKVFAAPASFIIDKKGNIKYTLYGATQWDSDEMVAALKALN